MRWSQVFIPTLREIPAEAEAPSHQLLLRAGYVRQVAAGVYAYLYQAQRSFLEITHEEEMTNIARGELRSYKQLPQIWYQIQEKFRDEPRPKSGLLRLRQFMMKDSYSFDLDEAGLDKSYDKHVEAYTRIFQRCGLKFMFVEAYSGMMGGKVSGEFTAPATSGEDSIASSECGYAANLEKAESNLPSVEDLPGEKLPEPFDTP